MTAILETVPFTNNTLRSFCELRFEYAHKHRRYPVLSVVSYAAYEMLRHELFNLYGIQFMKNGFEELYYYETRIIYSPDIKNGEMLLI